MTPFGEILKRVVETTPSAIGGAFADSQGEMVDAFSPTVDHHDWAILTAHYGVVLGHIHAVFGVWHFGGVEMFVAQHQRLSTVVLAVPGGYYALLALVDPAQVNDAIASLRDATRAIAKEMA